MKLLRIAIASALAVPAVAFLPGAHATLTGTGCVAIPDPTPATAIDVVGTCEYVARGTTGRYQSTAAHWQILVNGKVNASGFGTMNSVITTEPGDTVTALIFPDCDHLCAGLGFVTIMDDDGSDSAS